jgi:hypothetical protein
MSSSISPATRSRLAAALWASGFAAAQAGEIVLVRDAKLVEMSASVQADLSKRVLKLFATCSIDSRRHPWVFKSGQPPAMWRDTLGKDHARIRLSEPMQLRTPGSKAILVEEFLLGLGEPRYPGPHLARNGDEIVAYSKCSGGDTIRLMCAPGIKELMPSSYHEPCGLLEAK